MLRSTMAEYEKVLRPVIKKLFEGVPPEFKCMLAVTILRITKDVCQEEYDAGMKYCDEQLEDCSATEPDAYLQIIKFAIAGLAIIILCIQMS